MGQPGCALLNWMLSCLIQEMLPANRLSVLCPCRQGKWKWFVLSSPVMCPCPVLGPSWGSLGLLVGSLDREVLLSLPSRVFQDRTSSWLPDTSVDFGGNICMCMCVCIHVHMCVLNMHIGACVPVHVCVSTCVLLSNCDSASLSHRPWELSNQGTMLSTFMLLVPNST